MRLLHLFLFVSIFYFVSYAHAKVEFKPDKQTYKKGEKVCFTLKNASNQTVYLPSSAPWVVFKKDKVIYSPISNQVIVKLKPNQKKKWCWDQRTYKKGEKVLSGNYKIRITLFENGKREFLSFDVKIVPDYANAK